MSARCPRGGSRLGPAVILLLLVAWAVVLVPVFGSKRPSSSPLDGVRRFEQVMGVLANTRGGAAVPGRWVMVPKSENAAPARRRNRVIRRRRQTFARLVVAAFSTLLVAFFFHAFVLAHLAADVALAGYVLQLRRWRLREAQRARVVHPIVTEHQPEEIAAFG